MAPQTNAYARSSGLSRLALLFWLGSFHGGSLAADDFDPAETAYYLCAGCHGPEVGRVLMPMPADIPLIVGQKKDYLVKQLKAYRDGQRSHPNMSGPLTNYSDEQLNELAAYYEGLGPVRRARAKPQPKPAAVRPTPISNQQTFNSKHKHKKPVRAAVKPARSSGQTIPKEPLP